MPEKNTQHEPGWYKEKNTQAEEIVSTRVQKWEQALYTQKTCRDLAWLEQNRGPWGKWWKKGSIRRLANRDKCEDGEVTSCRDIKGHSQVSEIFTGMKQEIIEFWVRDRDLTSALKGSLWKLGHKQSVEQQEWKQRKELGSSCNDPVTKQRDSSEGSSSGQKYWEQKHVKVRVTRYNDSLDVSCDRKKRNQRWLRFWHEKWICHIVRGDRLWEEEVGDKEKCTLVLNLLICNVC